MKIIKHGSKYSEDKNSNFSLEAKFESMIKIAKKIINQNKNNTGDCSIETALAYDVANYLPKVLKENEELNEKILDNAGIYQLGFKDGEESYIKKVKDKIEEEKLPLVIVGGRRNKRTLEYGIKLGRRQVLQELLESEE